MLGTLDRYWWVFLLSGLCAIGFGILSFAWPGLTLLALVILFGVYGIADGVFAFAASRARHEAGQRWGAMVVAGIVSLLAGVAAFAWPGLTALVLLYIIAAWALLRGIIEIVAAIELRKLIRNEWVLAVAGVISILFAVLAIAQPGAGALAILWLIGAFAVIRGLMLVAVSLRLRSHQVVSGALGATT